MDFVTFVLDFSAVRSILVRALSRRCGSDPARALVDGLLLVVYAGLS